jgi:Uncharacterized protein conserved in bacteria (DUF2252)
LPGPFEWDVKRLAAGLVVAGRDNEFGRKHRRAIVLSAVEAYRTAMRAFAEQHFLDVWYAHLDVAAALDEVKSHLKRKSVKRTEKMLTKAHTRDSMEAQSKLTTVVDGQRQIISMPPLIEEIFADVQVAKIHEMVRTVLGKYRRIDNAIADFAETYADQNERDYAAFRAAVKDGRAEATTDI